MSNKFIPFQNYQTQSNSTHKHITTCVYFEMHEFGLI